MPDNTAPSAGRRRFALLLEYDGSRYAGSQLQANAETIQGVLEAAIVRTTGAHARVAFAGRTDAGVHARGQVACFTTNTALDEPTLQRALNARLPEDVAVRCVAAVDEAFDPRRDAVGRWYRYEIDNSAVRSPLARLRAWHVAARLDVSAMAEAAGRLVGVHDFAAFASPLENRGASTERALRRFDARRAGSKIFLDVEANAFLPHQVRRMTGALVEVGKGRMSVEQYRGMLEGGPASAGPSAPPHGLYLMKVHYERALFPALASEPSLC